MNDASHVKRDSPTQTLSGREAARALDIAESVSLTMFNLDLTIQNSALPNDVMLHRGIRSMRRTFGTDSARDLVGRTHTDLGYVAGSVYREVALRDFTTPKGALIAVQVPRTRPALWVARAGDPRLAWQGEVLLQARTSIQIHTIDDQAEIPVIYGEVRR